MTHAPWVPWLVVAAIYSGLLLSTTVLAVIWYDLVALRKGWRTFSNETMRLGTAHTFVMLTLTGMLTFAAGVLIGHLFFPQFVTGG